MSTLIIMICGFLTATICHAQSPEIYFDRDIMPIFSQAGCNAAGCHGTQVGQDGFAPSLFGGEPQSDFMAITQGIDTTTSMGRMLYGQLAVFAEFEREQISDRTKAGILGCGHPQ